MFFFSSYFRKWKKKSQILFYFLIKFHVKKNILQNSFFFFFFLFVLTQKIKFEPENHIFQLFYFPGVNPGKKKGFLAKTLFFTNEKQHFPRIVFFPFTWKKCGSPAQTILFTLFHTEKKQKKISSGKRNNS